MVTDERLAAFIHSLDTGNSETLDCVESEALAARVPVIRKDTQAFLKFLLALKEPASILEIGTGVGFSALLMAEYGPEGCHITTVENYGKRIGEARENIRRAGREGQITLLPGDAAEILPTLAGAFDFIFLDAAKGQYIRFLPELLRLLAGNGILLSDNVLQGGEILESRFAVERRNRTIHSRMRAYLYELTHHVGLATAILPVGDGVAVSVRAGQR